MEVKCTRCSFSGDISKFTCNNRVYKVCLRCRLKHREHDNKRKEAKKEYRKEYIKTNRYKGNKKEESQKYYLKNRDKVLYKNKLYASQNEDDLKQYISNWRKNNKHKVKEYAHRRRMKIKNNGKNNLTSGQIQELFKGHLYCEYCDSKTNLCLDHIIPISRGGENTLSNVTIACKLCNSSKHNKLLSEWRN